MPATPRTRPRLRFALVPGVVFSLAVAISAHAQPPELPKGKSDPKAKDLPVVKLPDGTFLWVGTPTDGAGTPITLTPQELQKLQDQIEQLKKQLAARKPAPPSGCAIRGRVEKRGDQFVAVLKLTCTFRTTQPQTAVALGGKRGFLVAASLDGSKLPVFDPTEDGFAVLAETPGDHTLVLDVEAPVTTRGAKPEVGFEIGLPKAPITTLAFEPPAPNLKLVNVTTRAPDPTKIIPPEPRRAVVDLKELAARPGREGYALGAVDSLELTWDPPAASAAQPADQVQEAVCDVTVQLTEGVVETTTKFKLRGPGLVWKLVAPANADVTADRPTAAGSEVGPILPPTVTKPADAGKPVWKVEFPAGSAASDWVVTAVTRQPRPKPEDAKHKGPFAVGPFSALDVLRQTGTVLVRAAPNTHFAFKHGPDLRKAEPPEPPRDDETVAFFRLTTGPAASANVTTAPMFTVESRPQQGGMRVKPTYRLTLTEAGWRVRADVRVFPVRTEVEAVAVDVPADWRGLEAAPLELVEGVQQGLQAEGFWAGAAARFAGGLRVPVVVRLATGYKQPFDLVLTATVPVEPGATSAVVPLPRFPGADEGETIVTASVSEGQEVRGESRDRDGEYAAWGTPLAPTPGADGRLPRAVATVSRKSEVGLARVALSWQPYRPDLAADGRADVTLGDRQLVVTQHVRLRSAEGLPRPLRFRGPQSPAGLRFPPQQPRLEAVGAGEWGVVGADGKELPADQKEVSLTLSFAVPVLPPDGADRPWAVPVPLLWPSAATRSESTVRVWSGTTTGHTIATESGGWREVQGEPVPDRDSLPSLTLFGSGADPLVLEARAIAPGAAVAVWADRGLVQAWNADDGVTSYRARFLLRRWLSPAVDVRLAGPLAGPNPEFLRDGLRVDAVPVAEPSGGGVRTFRVPLPAPRPGTSSVVEVRYQLPASRGRAGECVYHPPSLPGAAFAGPVRWHVTMPDGTVPMLTSGGTAEFRWRLRPLGLAPVPPASDDNLDRWFRTGDEAADGGNGESAVDARQPSPAAVTVYRVPRTGLLVACSVAAFVLVLLVARLPVGAAGPVVALGGGAIGVVTVFYPHPAAQVFGACQPGVAAAAAVLLVLVGARAYHRRQVSRMPGFAQSLPEPSGVAAPVPSSARKRPSGSGSPAPAGG